MNGLRGAAEDYLAMRRALGFKLVGEGRLLMRLVAYCEDHGVEHLTTETALAWAIEPGPRARTGEYHFGRKLMVARIFARHLKMPDPLTEIPPEDMLRLPDPKPVPYLYSPQEITALMAAADRLTPPLLAASRRTIIGLLAVTGMRSGEACRLDRDHVDLDNATLLVEGTKFGKSRQLFLHPGSVAALDDYAARRDRSYPKTTTSAFFITHRGNRFGVTHIAPTFAVLLDRAAIVVAQGRRRPRPHDLRHSFAVATLLDFYRDGGPTEARLPLLSTWLGHVDPKSTYWYLQAAPESLALAAARLEPGASS